MLKFYQDKSLSGNSLAEVVIQNGVNQYTKNDKYAMVKLLTKSNENHSYELIPFGAGEKYDTSPKVFNRVPYFGGCVPGVCTQSAFYLEDEDDDWLSMYITVQKSEKENEDIKVYFEKKELLKHGFKKLRKVDELYGRLNYSVEEYNGYIEKLKEIVKTKNTSKLKEIFKRCSDSNYYINSKIPVLRELDKLHRSNDEVSSELFIFLETLLTKSKHYSELGDLLYIENCNEKCLKGFSSLKRHFVLDKKLYDYNYYDFRLGVQGQSKGCFDIIEDDFLQYHFDRMTLSSEEVREYLKRAGP
ncbi:hypothetical protein M900_2145 [Bacteriovorax sp. Seq25_V]|nr:hypothetical protein M900_2145 [Bacteriovorax sp. Seq25_V]